MPDTALRAAAFRALHDAPGAVVTPACWGAGTARLLTGLGFPALETTSAGLAWSLGRTDAHGVTREETLANARAILAATHLPVSADLEAGFGPRAEDVADTIRLAAEAGLIGGSIEDSNGQHGGGNPDAPLFDLAEAVDRMAAAAETAGALPFPFTLTARCEGLQQRRLGLDQVIRRLQSYAAAGADVVYAPGLTNLEDVRTLCAAVEVPVAVLTGSLSAAFSVAELAAAGVRRVTLGSALARAALGGVLAAARELAGPGTCGFAAGLPGFAESQALMRVEAGAGPAPATGLGPGWGREEAE